jgi:hypothetical protein
MGSDRSPRGPTTTAYGLARMVFSAVGGPDTRRSGSRVSEPNRAGRRIQAVGT